MFRFVYIFSSQSDFLRFFRRTSYLPITGSKMDRNQGRKGADGTKMYICGVCRRVELSCYLGWIFHVGTREHQVNLYKSGAPKRWKFNSRYNSKVIEVKGILGLTSNSVLEYLKIWGEIADFNYAFRNEGENGKTDTCHVIYKDK